MQFDPKKTAVKFTFPGWADGTIRIEPELVNYMGAIKSVLKILGGEVIETRPDPGREYVPVGSRHGQDAGQATQTDAGHRKTDRRSGKGKRGATEEIEDDRQGGLF